MRHLKGQTEGGTDLPQRYQNFPEATVSSPWAYHCQRGSEAGRSKDDWDGRMDTREVERQEAGENSLVSTSVAA